jgi:tRNA (adenine22-N1)-methyltransferase
MKISKRIQKIIEYIDVEDSVADIGCDHGYLGLGCLEKGIKFLQNIDNKKGPLTTAMKNLSDYQMNDNVIYTLCDGLDNLDSRVDTIVISGMGGDLINQIINRNLEKAKKLKKIIIVAHTKLFLLRKELTKNFYIIDETIISEKNKLYEIIIFKPSGEAKTNYNYDDCLLGPIQKIKKEDLFIDKWNSRLEEIEKILKNTTNADLEKEKDCIIRNLK